MDTLHQSWITFLYLEKIHNLRNFQIILNENIKAVRYGSETIKLGNVIHLPVGYADLFFRI